MSGINLNTGMLTTSGTYTVTGINVGSTNIIQGNVGSIGVSPTFSYYVDRTSKVKRPRRFNYNTSIIDDPKFDHSFANQYEALGISDDDDCLIKPNHIIHGNSPHGLTIKQKKELCDLVKYFNKYELDIKVRVDKHSNLIIKSHRGEMNLTQKTSKDDVNNVTYLFKKRYTLVDKFHWFNFVYFDLSKIVFIEICKNAIELNDRLKQFRHEIIDTMQPGMNFDNQDIHPVTFLYQLIFDDEYYRNKKKTKDMVYQ